MFSKIVCKLPTNQLELSLKKFQILKKIEEEPLGLNFPKLWSHSFGSTLGFHGMFSNMKTFVVPKTNF